jgi:hypothetical protein
MREGLADHCWKPPLAGHVRLRSKPSQRGRIRQFFVSHLISVSNDKRAALVLTEPIKSRMGGLVQTAFWEVRSELFGSRLSQDASSKRKTPALSNVSRGQSFFGSNIWVQLGPVLGSFSGLNEQNQRLVLKLTAKCSAIELPGN